VCSEEYRWNPTLQPGILATVFPGGLMTSRVQELAATINMTFDEFIGEMRKRGCSEATAARIWRGCYEDFNDYNDNDVHLSNLRKAATVLRVRTGTLLPR
jgi:hypothetical protein